MSIRDQFLHASEIPPRPPRRVQIVVLQMATVLLVALNIAAAFLAA